MQSDSNLRKTGLIIMLIGGAISYWQIIKPISDAFFQKDMIFYSEKIALLSGAAFLFGLLLAVFGKKFDLKPTNLNIALVLISILLYSFGCLWGMQFILSALGYD